MLQRLCWNNWLKEQEEFIQEARVYSSNPIHLDFKDGIITVVILTLIGIIYEKLSRSFSIGNQ
jgi:hypothetical protein